MDPYRQPDWVPKRAKKEHSFCVLLHDTISISGTPTTPPFTGPTELGFGSPRVEEDTVTPARSVVEAPMHCPTSAAEVLTFSSMKSAHVVARLRERGCRPPIGPYRSCGAVPGRSAVPSRVRTVAASRVFPLDFTPS